MHKIPVTAFAAAILESGALQIGNQLAYFGWHFVSALIVRANAAAVSTV